MPFARLPVALVVALAGCSGVGAGSDGSISVARAFNVVRHPVVERVSAPALEGVLLRGGSLEPQITAGKVAVVNFWGTWCGPCREEQPRLEALWKRFRGQDVVFVGVNTRRDQKAAALAYLDEFDVTYPSIYDPDSAIAFAYRVRVMPATFVIDPKGKIAATILGAVRSAGDLTEILDEELA
jgi:thiol-disulfide isomerase/thioredoxin